MKECSKFLFITLLFFQTFANSYGSESELNPVILTPGYGGSQAFQRTDRSYKHIWLSVYDLLFNKDFSDIFGLRYDKNTGTTIRESLGHVKFPGWGATWATNKINLAFDYFQHISDLLTTNPYYVHGVTLRSTPYDFRRTIDDNTNFVPSMMSLVEETYLNAGNRRVVLIGHSMGTVYIHNFLAKMTDSWKQRYIESFLAMSGPWAGATKAIHAIIRGDNLGAPIHEMTLRRTLRSYPSTHLLIPNKKVFPSDKNFIEIIGQRNYTVNDIHQLYSDLGIAEDLAMLEDVRELPDFTKRPTGVDKLYCMYSHEVPTRSQMIYNDPKFFPNGAPISVYKNGDGTVDIDSLRVCENWEDVEYSRIKSVDHRAILYNEDALQFIKNTLKL